MNKRKMAKLEKRVPILAGRALGAADRRARASGVTLVVVKEGGLYKRKPTGEYELIEQLPPRTKVTTRVKYARV